MKRNRKQKIQKTLEKNMLKRIKNQGAWKWIKTQKSLDRSRQSTPKKKDKQMAENPQEYRKKDAKKSHM